MTSPLLSIENLTVHYGAATSAAAEAAVAGLSLSLQPGETLALVGESGCGKSTTALAIPGLQARGARVSGRILFDGADLLAARPRDLEGLRGREIGVVFQEPMTSLNPVHRIGAQIDELLRAHLRLSGAERRARVLALLAQVQLPEPERLIDAYPHQLSGGQRQRVMIAMAIALRPRLLIADEPTTALDATIQAQIMELLFQLRRELGMAMILVSHDLGLVARWADRTLVMHRGRIVDSLARGAPASTLQHPYARGLLQAALRPDDRRHVRHDRLAEIHGRRQGAGFAFEVRVPPLPQIPPPAGHGQPGAALLEVRDLVVRHPGAARPAVGPVGFTLRRGEILGLVGESGCGKSTLSRALLRLVAPDSGQILYAGEPVQTARGARLARYRRKVQMVFQDPYGSLNPRVSIGDMLERILRLDSGLRAPGRQAEIARVLDLMGLPSDTASRFAHEFSGGQRQRIAIARALILRPELLVCDEPVSALDVSVQARILNLLGDLRAELGLSMLFISHDLKVVRYLSDRVMVMQAGHILETATPEELWRAPQHPFTRQLLSAA